MTRLKYYLPVGFLILAVMVALAAGFGLAVLGDFSTQTVGRLFAVPYRLALLCSAALAASAVSMIERNRRIAARKHAAKRAVLRREAVGSRKPLPPSGPQRLPRAA